MRASGWLDVCEDSMPDVGSLTPAPPSIIQSGKLWGTAVLDKQ